MSVKVVLENVGGLSGVHVFEFVKGAVNIAKAPNAAGKTTIIKAIASCLSAPYRSKNSVELAREMGLLKQPSEVVEPLVHMNANAAKITIKLDGDEWRYTLFRDGKYNYTKKADERFLITSVVTRDSRILKKLTSGDVDLMWVVETVSLANRYEIAAGILEEEKTRLEALLEEEVERVEKEVESLRKEEEVLRKIIDRRKHEEDMWNRKLSDLLKRHPEVDELRKQRDKLVSKIKSIEADIEEIRREIEKLKEKKDEKARELETKLHEKESLERKSKKVYEELRYVEERKKTIDKNLKNYEEQLKRINEQIEDLRVEEGRLLAKSEMYKKALKLAAKTREVLCFLCEKGYLTAEVLEQRKLLTEKQLSEVRDNISRLLSRRNSIYSEIKEREELESRSKELSKQLTEIMGVLQEVNKALLNYEMEINGLEMRITSLETVLKEKQRSHAKYEAELTAIEKTIRESGGEEERKVVIKLAEIRGELSELKRQLNKVVESLNKLRSNVIEVYGHKITLEKARRMLPTWVAEIDEIIKRIRAEARRERVMAAELFNNQVKRVLVEFGFEYLDVWIDVSDYRLHIIDKRTGREVTPRVLSETERYALALIVHIAMKLTYTPHIPFFLIDEIVLSFDEARRKATLKHLSDLAKENSWVVIVTELNREPKMTVSVLRGP